MKSKKIRSLFCAAALTLSLAACGSKTSDCSGQTITGEITDIDGPFSFWSDISTTISALLHSSIIRSFNPLGTCMYPSTSLPKYTALKL